MRPRWCVCRRPTVHRRSTNGHVFLGAHACEARVVLLDCVGFDSSQKKGRSAPAPRVSSRLHASLGSPGSSLALRCCPLELRLGRLRGRAFFHHTNQSCYLFVSSPASLSGRPHGVTAHGEREREQPLSSDSFGSAGNTDRVHARTVQ